MRVEYNGVEMDLVEIVSYTRENIYTPDKVDLLYTQHRVSMVCTLAPGGYPRAVSLKEAQSPGFGSTTYPDTVPGSSLRTVKRGTNRVPVAASALFTDPDKAPNALTDITQPGAMLTDHEVRARLMMPRKKFIISAFEETTGLERTWVECPRLSGTRPPIPAESSSAVIESSLGRAATTPAAELFGLCDPANGPTPLRCDAVQMQGEGVSAGILYTIEFAVIPVHPAAERLILSHRWETQYQSDGSQYMNRVTTGALVFNGSLLAAYPDGVAGFARESPDVYRNQFFHPIPVGFVRSLPEFTISSDGLNVRYVILDEQPACIFSPGDSGAVKMEIEENMNLLHPDPLAIAEKVATQILMNTILL